MFDKFDYCDEKYPFKYSNNQKTYEILKNTKNLIKNSKSYFNFSSKYFNMTTKSTFKVPEITQYPIVKNTEMTAITRQSFDFGAQNISNFNFGNQDMTQLNPHNNINSSFTPLKVEEILVTYFIYNNIR